MNDPRLLLDPPADASAGLPVLTPALVRAAAPSPALPDGALLGLPERAIQFGTGAFLRGFVCDLLDRANRAGVFNGRLVMVGSTGSGRDRTLSEQGGLFTLVVQGMDGGRPVREPRVVASVSRALAAAKEWDAVLACARDPRIAFIFSNTTEVGITLDEDDRPDLAPPRSFPGKLTRYLYERAGAFDFDPVYAPIVIPCELVEDNGARLREIVLALADRWELGPRFAAWVEGAVTFCNTLVDRIVPGTPAADEHAALEAELGWRDGLMTVAEPYRLFAIQGDARLRARLPFALADEGVVVADDVAPYRERKVRLLNGGHTAMVAAALLCGCETVLDAVRDPRVGPFLRHLLLDEILPTVDAPGAEAFAHAVLERFANPYVRHALVDITLQHAMKLRVRLVPAILRYAELTGRVPASLAFGYAASLLLARGDLHDARRAAGLAVPADEQGDHLRAAWNGVDASDEAALGRLVRRVGADVHLWGDLSRVPGWSDAVTAHLVACCRDGVPAALDAHLASVGSAAPEPSTTSETEVAAAAAGSPA